MFWWDSCFYLRVVLYALDFLVCHGDMEKEEERNMMAYASHLSKAIQKQLDEIREHHKSIRKLI